METDGVNDDHPLGVFDDLVASCPIHNQMKPRPQNQSLAGNHRIPADCKEEYRKPFQISRRKIHEFEQKTKRVWNDA